MSGIKIVIDSFAYTCLTLYGLRGDIRPGNLCDLVKESFASLLYYIIFVMGIVGMPFSMYIAFNRYSLFGSELIVVATVIIGAAFNVFLFGFLFILLLALAFTVFSAIVNGIIDFIILPISNLLNKGAEKEISFDLGPPQSVKMAWQGFKDKFCPIVEYKYEDGERVTNEG